MLYFIVNETARSGKGRRIWNELAEVLAERNTPYKAWITRYEGHAGVLAAEICEKNDDDICMVVVGGDGTANEVINGITDFEKYGSAQYRSDLGTIWRADLASTAVRKRI